MSDRGRNDGDIKRNSVSSGRPSSGSNASPRNAVKEERVERNERDRTGRTSSNERFSFFWISVFTLRPIYGCIRTFCESMIKSL